MNISDINSAAMKGDIDTIRLLLAEGYDINDRQNEWYSTPLMFAVQNSNGTSSIETVRFLLDHGANINVANGSGNTALFFAALYSNSTSSIETVKLLLEYGANVNVFTTNRYTPLMLAVKYSNTTSSNETIRVLLEAGANINVVGNNGFTPLMLAAKYSNTTSSLDTVKLLIDAGANINILSNSGSALKIAAQYANETSSIETVKLLLEAGASPFIRTNRDRLSEEVEMIINEYRWKTIYNNIKLQAKQYSKSENIPEGDLILPYDVWELILLRHKQRQLCRNLKSSDNKYILLGFAEMLEIPIPENITKNDLCTIISEQLAWGGKYSPDSATYSNKRYNDARENIVKLAYRLGIDIHQPMDTILDEIGSILNLR